MCALKRYLFGLWFVMALTLYMGQANALTIEELGEDGSVSSHAMVPYKPPVADMPEDAASQQKSTGKGTAVQLLKEAEKQTNIFEEFKKDVWQASLEEAEETKAGFFGSMWIGFRNTMTFSGKKAVEIAKPVAVAAIKAKVWSWFI